MQHQLSHTIESLLPLGCYVRTLDIKITSVIPSRHLLSNCKLDDILIILAEMCNVGDLQSELRIL